MEEFLDDRSLNYVGQIGGFLSSNDSDGFNEHKRDLFCDWGNYASNDNEWCDVSEINKMVKTNVCFISEFEVLKKYIKLKNVDEMGHQCLFCGSKPKTLQTLKEHLKKSCRFYREMERSWGLLGILERRILIFMVTFIIFYMRTANNVNMENFSGFCMNVWGSMFSKFNDMTGAFPKTESTIEKPREDVYNCCRFRFREKDKALSRVIKFS